MFQLIGSYLAYLNGGFINYSILETVEYFNIKFEHLCDIFRDLLKIKDPVLRRRLFRKAVKYHYNLIESVLRIFKCYVTYNFFFRLCEMLNDCYRPLGIMHFLASGPTLGLCEYRLFTVSEMFSYTTTFQSFKSYQTMQLTRLSIYIHKKD